MHGEKLKKIKAPEGHSEEPNEHMSFGVHKTFDQESLSSRADFKQNPKPGENIEKHTHKTTETVRKEINELNYLIKLNNEANNNSKSTPLTKKITTIYLYEVVWASFKKFSHFQELSASEAANLAFVEYMKNHADELPVHASFNLTVQFPKEKSPYRNVEASIIKKDFSNCLVEAKKHLTDPLVKKEVAKFWKDALNKHLKKALKVGGKLEDIELDSLIEETRQILVDAETKGAP